VCLWEVVEQAEFHRLAALSVEEQPVWLLVFYVVLGFGVLIEQFFDIVVECNS
jgi:hypothetical protein